jgi:FixJ family two-component response regulator
MPLVSVVDDDASVRQSSCRLIRSLGYRCEEFGSGDEFLRSPVVTATSCLVLDVRMPGIDGLEVQRQLRERGESIPIIFVTGRASDQEERRARAAGAVDFFRKPVGRVTLERALERALHDSSAVEEGSDE